VRWLDGVNFIDACTTLAGPPPATNGKDHTAPKRPAKSAPRRLPITTRLVPCC
jgi:hypothetical protein